MISKIHPSAIVSSEVKISTHVEIGPFTVIEPDVIIEEGTKIHNNVTIKTGARIGKSNIIYPGSVVAAIPQDLKFAGEYTELFIGDNNIIREFVTISRGTAAKNKTTIGNNCLFMANSHVGHDCIIGDNCIFANSVALAGHVEIQDYAILGGLTGVHQFVKIGRHVMIGAHSMVVKDVPPFSLFSGHPLEFEGLNIIGLRRRGFSDEIIDTLKKAYKFIYNSGLNVSQAIEKIKSELPASEYINEILSFIENSNRGVAK
jgi:UDP-N-acetylglucosamine acyltransferase